MSYFVHATAVDCNLRPYEIWLQILSLLIFYRTRTSAFSVTQMVLCLLLRFVLKKQHQREFRKGKLHEDEGQKKI